MDLCTLAVGQPEKMVAGLSPRLRNCTSVEQAASLLCQELCARCRSEKDGELSLVACRLYVSLPYTGLDPETARMARKSKSRPTPDDHCLTLVGTYGVEPEWCDRRLVAGWRVFWLGRYAPPRDPLLKRCFEQVGFDLERLGVDQDRIWVPRGVFVAEAAKDPAFSEMGDLARAYGIASGIGGGACLPDGAISLWIAFSRHAIGEQGALPLLPLLPSFWYEIRDLYQKRALFS
ncbi:MAG: hypothetical protein U0166_26440 [Acidobacteriota bacterium]